MLGLCVHCTHRVPTTVSTQVLSSTTFLARKNALHLAAENGQIVVLSSILEALLCQASLGTNDVQKQVGTKLSTYTCHFFRCPSPAQCCLVGCVVFSLIL